MSGIITEGTSGDVSNDKACYEGVWILVRLLTLQELKMISARIGYHGSECRATCHRCIEYSI